MTSKEIAASTLTTTVLKNYETLLADRREGRFKIEAPLRETKGDAAASASGKEQVALDLLRYAIENILGWTPKEAASGLTSEIAESLCFPEIIRDRVQIPDDVRDDYRWVVSRIYPKEVRYDLNAATLDMYRAVLTKERKQFPTNFFKNPERGRKRLHILIRYVVSTHFPGDDMESLYRYFANEAQGAKFLHDVLLYNPYKTVYNTTLEAFHNSLGDDGVDLYYNVYGYLDACGKIMNDIREERKKEKKARKKAVAGE